MRMVCFFPSLSGSAFDTTIAFECTELMMMMTAPLRQIHMRIAMMANMNISIIIMQQSEFFFLLDFGVFFSLDFSCMTIFRRNDIHDIRDLNRHHCQNFERIKKTVRFDFGGFYFQNRTVVYKFYKYRAIAYRVSYIPNAHFRMNKCLIIFSNEFMKKSQRQRTREKKVIFCLPHFFGRFA